MFIYSFIFSPFCQCNYKLCNFLSIYKIPARSRDSSAVIATGYRLGDPGFDSRLGKSIFLHSVTSKLALRPTQPPNQCVPRTISSGVKRPGRESGHSLPSNAEVPSTPPYVFMARFLINSY
jgi:hypothetical protein